MLDYLQTAVGADVLRIVGVLGFLTYVTLYSCLSLRVLHSDSILYFCGNIFAATLVLISLAQEFNLAAALIQSFWIAMGIPAIILRLVHRRSDRRAASYQAQNWPQTGGATPVIPPEVTGPHTPDATRPWEPAGPAITGRGRGPLSRAAGGYRTGIAG